MATTKSLEKQNLFPSIPSFVFSLPLWCDLSSTPVPNAGNFAFGPENIFVRSATSLILSQEYIVKLLQVRQRGLIIVGPIFFLRALGLKPPGSSRFDYPNLPLGTVIVPFYPGMAIMHSP
jgi:hypothetical protein